MSSYENLPKGIPSIAAAKEHESVAFDFANAMLNQFQEHELVEILNAIKVRWSERIAADIEISEKRLAYLRDVSARL